jgi:HEAT repeat protein
MRKARSPKDSWRRYWVLDAFGFLGDRRAVDVIIRTMEASNDREIIEGASAALSRLGDTKAIEPIRRTLTRLKVQKTSPGYWETALNAALKSLGES